MNINEQRMCFYSSNLDTGIHGYQAIDGQNERYPSSYYFSYGKFKWAIFFN